MYEKKGLTQIYCGPGKGKTSVAIGQAIRAVGHGKRAIVIQFLKGRETSRLDYLSSMEPELVRDMGVRSFKDMKDLLAEVDFNGKDVYVIPYGGSVLPQTKEAYERICREAEENGGAK